MKQDSLQVAEQIAVAELSHIKNGMSPTKDPRVWVHPQYGKVVLTDEDMAEVEYNAKLVKQGLPSNIMDNARNMAETRMMNKLHTLDQESYSADSGGIGLSGAVLVLTLIVLLGFILAS